MRHDDSWCRAINCEEPSFEFGAINGLAVNNFIFWNGSCAHGEVSFVDAILFESAEC